MEKMAQQKREQFNRRRRPDTQFDDVRTDNSIKSKTDDVTQPNMEMEDGTTTMTSDDVRKSNMEIECSIRALAHSALIDNELERLRILQGNDHTLSKNWRSEYDDVSNLHYAAFYGDKISVERILKSDPLSYPDLPTTAGPKLLKQERQLKEDPFIRNKYFGFFLNTTPLMMASQQGHINVVKYLIEHAHADVNARDTLGMTSLSIASSCGQTEVTKYLLSKRAMVNAQEYHSGMTALILAAVNNQTETVKIVLNRHANIHLKDKHGRRAIHYAAWNYNWNLVHFLAKHHDIEREINAHDHHGNTPLHVLLSDFDIEPVVDDFQTSDERRHIETILRHITSTEMFGTFVNLRRSQQRGTGKPGERLNCFIKMIRLGADIFARNNDGQNALHVICGRLTPVYYSHGFLKIDDLTQTQDLLVIVEVLLKLGAIPNAADYEGHTPISLSESQENCLAVKRLKTAHVPNSSFLSNAYSTLTDAIRAFEGWGHVVKLTEFENDVEMMADALMETRKQNKTVKLAERIMNHIVT